MKGLVLLQLLAIMVAGTFSQTAAQEGVLTPVEVKSAGGETLAGGEMLWNSPPNQKWQPPVR